MPRNQKDARPKRRSAGKKTKAAKATPKKSTSAGQSRAEGIRLFALAGRPSKNDFVKVYGPAGPKMTWEQRVKTGVPAEKFQTALASATRQGK
jgi:hypothetical protein